MSPNAKTAITRKSPSLPMKYLAKHKLLTGRMLDYGCGRGFDADHFGMVKYDPNHAPVRPRGKFDTITCNYVLNVVDAETERKILNDIKSLLREGGTAYVSVRRDIDKDIEYKGYSQRLVKLHREWELVTERKGSYAMYKFTNNELGHLLEKFNPHYEFTTSRFQFTEQSNIHKRIKELRGQK